MRKILLACAALAAFASIASADEIVPATACGGATGIACPAPVPSGTVAVPATPCGDSGQIACPAPTPSVATDVTPAMRITGLPKDFFEQFGKVYEEVIGVPFDKPAQACDRPDLLFPTELLLCPSPTTRVAKN